MLPVALITEIDRLLRAGELSQRKIAAHLGVSRGVVSAISHGRRGLHGKETDPTRIPLHHARAPSRCPNCGYRVQLPCLICKARSRQRSHQLLQVLAGELNKKPADTQQVPMCADGLPCSAERRIVKVAKRGRSQPKRGRKRRKHYPGSQ
jgi:hypothetical protein